MSDFLQSLRGGQKDKRTPKTRRGFDSNSNPHYSQAPNYPSGGYQNSRPGNVKRVTRSNSPAKYPGPDIEMPAGNDDFLERALDVLDGFLKNQERLVDIQQRRILVEERKADALEEIAAHFKLNSPPEESMEGYQVSGDEETSGEGSSAEIMENDFRAKGDVEDLEPLFDQNLQEGRAEQERMMDTSSCANELPVPEQPAQVNGDLFSSVTPSPAREKQISSAKSSHKKVEHSGVRAKKRVSRSIEKNEIKKEVKVIKRSRADKARATQVQIKTDEPKVASSPVEGLLPREEVMHIIESMREKGATFDQVATYLVSINQPTFSGRGEWHAQTVHRLCNRKK